MNDLDILMEFLRMPLGTAKPVFEKFSEIPNVIRRGKGLKQFLYARGSRENKVLLIAHADTHWDQAYGYQSQKQEIYQHQGIIRNKRGGLGADDRAGCAIVWLLKSLGHSLLIINGEEGGGQGSRWLMAQNEDIAEEINHQHQFMVQFDRCNGTDFKCYDVGTDEFRDYIQQVTGYSEPDRFSYTDIVTLCQYITGVNLSIGYRNEHTSQEYLVIQEWDHTLNLCRRWLSKPELPHFRLGK